MIRTAILALGLALAATPLAAREEAPIPPRTPVEALDMASPEAAALSFVEHYARSDYFSAYFLLSPKAKRGFRQVVQVHFSLAPLFPGVEKFDLPGSVMDPATRKARQTEDADLDPSLFFDNLMLAAERNGKLPFRIARTAQVAITHSEGETARAEVTTKAEPEKLDLDLARLPNGDWRIERIAWAGSDPNGMPWGIPRLRP